MSEIAMIQTYTVVAVATIICVCAIATAFSFAYLGGKFLESVARQPEMATMLTGRLLLIAGLLDALPMMGVGVSLWFATNNPFITALLGKAAA